MRYLSWIVFSIQWKTRSSKQVSFSLASPVWMSIEAIYLTLKQLITSVSAPPSVPTSARAHICWRSQSHTGFGLCALTTQFGMTSSSTLLSHLGHSLDVCCPPTLISSSMSSLSKVALANSSLSILLLPWTDGLPASLSTFSLPYYSICYYSKSFRLVILQQFLNHKASQPFSHAWGSLLLFKFYLRHTAPPPSPALFQYEKKKKINHNVALFVVANNIITGIIH